ncbi:hypothetical protein [Buchananella hordeovulneris]|uniref:hypothetical protein n=1 Tax=Buchananella hordeovulneris TaxID=52770 RepID=UPI000F5FDE80|nr:hypothetical protein [Buchananella hordeovulneris]RRD43184.1 hypothetical protein EII13_07905 [Buchananella hordeovulneris]
MELRRVLLITLGAVVGLAGCGGSVESTSVSRVAAVGDLAAWRPDTRVSLPELTEAERERLRVETLDAAREISPELESLPLPKVVRWGTLDEPMQGLFDCLLEAGYGIEPWPDKRGYSFTLGDGQKMEDYDRQHWLCRAQYPEPAEHMRPLTREQWAVYYEYLTEYFISCARSMGVEFADGEVPSQEAWVDARMSPSGAQAQPAELFWFPNEVGGWSEATQRRYREDPASFAPLFARCPAMPPAQYFYP